MQLIPEVQDAQVQTDATYETSKEPKSIIEEIKEAAELATQNSGFVYDECSGMYYDANTGYYYNAVTQSFGVCYFYWRKPNRQDYGLYYEPSSCTYLKYKADTNTYEFHSRPFAALQESFAQKEIVKRKKKSKDELKVSRLSVIYVVRSENLEVLGKHSFRFGAPNELLQLFEHK